MRRAARVDGPHKAIVTALRAIGCDVLDLSAVGRGCPDLLVRPASAEHGLLVEVKNGALSASRRKLTPAQVKFHGQWRGAVLVVTSVEEALRLFGARVAA